MNYNDFESVKQVQLLEEFIYGTMLPEILKSKSNEDFGVKSFNYENLFRKLLKCGESVQPEFAVMLREDILNDAFYTVLDQLKNAGIIIKLPMSYYSNIDINEVINKQVQNIDMQKIFKYMDSEQQKNGIYQFDMEKYFYEELPVSERTFENKERLSSLINQFAGVLFKADVLKSVCDEVYTFDRGLCDIERLTKNIYSDSVKTLKNKIVEVCEGNDVLDGDYYDKQSEEVLKTIYKLAETKFKGSNVYFKVDNCNFAVVNLELLKSNMKEYAVSALKNVANDYLLEDQVEPFLRKYSKLYNEYIAQKKQEELEACD